MRERASERVDRYHRSSPVARWWRSRPTRAVMQKTGWVLNVLDLARGPPTLSRATIRPVRGLTRSISFRIEIREPQRTDGFARSGCRFHMADRSDLRPSAKTRHASAAG